MVSVAGYTLQADLYCPRCVLHALVARYGVPRRNGTVIPPIVTSDGSAIAVEESLNVFADFLGLDRHQESGYDSADFPKVVFAHMVEEGDRCGACGGLLWGWRI